jgi:hypothetical protein
MSTYIRRLYCSLRQLEKKLMKSLRTAFSIVDYDYASSGYVGMVDIEAFSTNTLKVALVQLTLDVNCQGTLCEYAEGYTLVQTKHIKPYARLHLRQGQT